MKDFWNGIYGQQNARGVLSNLILTKKIPHALLFNGPNGVGKDFIALRFAQAVNASNESLSNPEKVINSITNLNEPYIKFIAPLPRGRNETDTSGPLEKLSNDEIQIVRDELQKKINNFYYQISIPKANIIKISSIRDIKKFLSFNFEENIYRFVIIADAHLMNEEAQNALLKNIEEPPEGVIFILITHAPEKLRETIRSRCWTINFNPLSSKDVTQILIKYFDFEEDTAAEIAKFSGGSVNTALNISEYDFKLLKEKTVSILRYSLGRKFNSAFNEFYSVLEDGGNDMIKLIVYMMITWLNDIQKHRFELDDYFFHDYKETLDKFNNKFGDTDLNELVFKLDRLSSLLQNNINPNLVILCIVYEISALITSYHNKVLVE